MSGPPLANPTEGAGVGTTAPGATEAAAEPSLVAEMVVDPVAPAARPEVASASPAPASDRGPGSPELVVVEEDEGVLSVAGDLPFGQSHVVVRVGGSLHEVSSRLRWVDRCDPDSTLFELDDESEESHLVEVRDGVLAARDDARRMFDRLIDHVIPAGQVRMVPGLRSFFFNLRFLF